MAVRNYRLAKRSREESRKKRQQEKMLRKANRGVVDPVSPDSASNPVDATEKAVP